MNFNIALLVVFLRLGTDIVEKKKENLSLRFKF